MYFDRVVYDDNSARIQVTDRFASKSFLVNCPNLVSLDFPPTL
jgi:hypothetical protein